MPVPTSKRFPKLRNHKHTGQGYVVLNGRAVYLGRAGLPETEQRYHQLIAEWIAAGRQAPVEPQVLTVKELIARYWVHANAYYVGSDGKPTSQVTRVLPGVLRPLKKLYGDCKACQFTPLMLKAVRQQMIAQGWARTTINLGISRIKQVFRWGVENGLILGSVLHGLEAVSGLRQGRSEARESEPVRPVPIPSIEAIKPFVPKPIWAMIQLQLLTAARAGEIVTMRLCDLDMSGRVWTFRPDKHKKRWQRWWGRRRRD